MTVRPDMHVGNYGSDIEMTINNRKTNRPIALSGATTLEFLFQPPTGDAFARDAEMVTPPGGLDGKIKYTIASGDFTVEGDWTVQGHVIDDVGDWHTDIEEFKVGGNIILPAP